MTTGIVIGATGGIGGSCARLLTDAADHLVLTGRRGDTLQALVEELGQPATGIVADLATKAGRAAIVNAVQGPLGWVVLAHGAPMRKPLIELDSSEIEALFAANLVGPTILLAELLRLDWGEPKAIVVIGSISASRSLPRRAAYGATKAGLEHLARSLAAELGPAGLRVNIVAPGVIETPFLGDDTEPLADWVQDRVPLRRVGHPDEVASVVQYLLTNSPQYLTGARIVVDGGAEALG